jgi:predicted nucleic acid-binding Zn ribbon protein
VSSESDGSESPEVTRGDVIKPTSGDNPVDSVDNAVTQRPNGPSKTGKPDNATARTSELATDGDQATGPELRGSDLARAALAAAREVAKARNPTGRKGVSGALPSRSRRRRRWSGAGADDRDPQPLGRLASRVATARGWNERLVGGQVFGKWAELVGEEVAEHAKPVTLKEGELTVAASSTAWATQLRLLQRQLIAKIARGVGNGVVTKLKVQGPAAPSWRKGPRHVSGRGPRDTYG